MNRRKMKFIGILVLLFLGIGCKSHENGFQLIEKDKMTLIITDLHLAEARMQINASRSSDTTKYRFVKMQETIFEKYRVSRRDYDSSYRFYCRNLREFDEIYEKVVDSLNVRQSKMQDF